MASVHSNICGLLLWAIFLHPLPFPEPLMAIPAAYWDWFYMSLPDISQSYECPCIHKLSIIQPYILHPVPAPWRSIPKSVPSAPIDTE